MRALSILTAFLVVLLMGTAGYGGVVAQRRTNAYGHNPSELKNLDLERTPVPDESTLFLTSKPRIIRRQRDFQFHENLDHTNGLTDVVETVNCNEEPENFKILENYDGFTMNSRALTLEISTIATKLDGFTGDEMEAQDKKSILCELSRLMKMKSIRTNFADHKEIKVYSDSEMTMRNYTEAEADHMEGLRSKLGRYRFNFITTMMIVKGSQTTEKDNNYDCKAMYDRLQGLYMNGADGYRGGGHHLIMCNIETSIDLIDGLLEKLNSQIQRHRSQTPAEADFFIACLEPLDIILKISLTSNRMVANLYQWDVANN